MGHKELGGNTKDGQTDGPTDRLSFLILIVTSSLKIQTTRFHRPGSLQCDNQLLLITVAVDNCKLRQYTT